jgi:hypothetical protein
MATEYLVGDSIVACLLIKAPASQLPPATIPSLEPWFRSLAQLLRAVCLPKVNAVKLFAGQAYHPVYANNLDPKYSCSWTETGDGGGYGQIILARADQPKLRVRVDVQLRVAKDGRWAWLTVGHNPTTLTVGHNVHPAAYIDPTTGVIDNWPSSSWPAMTRAFRLGFAFLEAMSEPHPLFDAATKRVIAHGHFHLVSVQYAATKAVTNVTDFLQVSTVIYGQTKARGKGIVNNAKDLGLRFKPYALPDPYEDRLSGFMLQKLHGTKLHVSDSFYDKLIRLQQMHQEGTLTPAEAETVDRSVREDITAHSTFIQYIAEAAQKKLRRMSEADRKFFDLISPEEFLQGTPQPTVWWLQRAIYVLSHWHVQGRWLRYSFATWLVPYVEQELLHFDVVASITTEGYHALLALNDTVAVAWRSDPTPGAGNWAGRLAQIAGCSRSTVFNRRDKWRRVYGIDIAFPLQMYSDILYYGHNSLAKPESITALMEAVDQEDGDEVVRLHADAIAYFERKRVQIVNPAFVRRPRAMELKLPPIAPPVVALPEPDDPDDLEFIDLDDLDLIAAVPTRPRSAIPILAPSSAGSHAPQVRPGRAQESRTSIVLRPSPPPPPPTRKKLVLPSPPPPPTPKKLVLRGPLPTPPPPPTPKKLVLRGPLPTPPPPPTRKKLVLRGPLPSPPPPSTGSNVVLQAAHRSPPSRTEKKVVPRAMRSPPPAATAVRISTGRSGVASVDATIRREASEQYFDYRSSVRRARLASKSWTRT